MKMNEKNQIKDEVFFSHSFIQINRKRKKKSISKRF